MKNLNELMDQAIVDNPTTFTRWDGKPFVRGVGVSASELWTCARQTWFKRAGTEVDDGYTDNIGYFDRGHAVEDRAVYRLAQAVTTQGWGLKFAGDDQRTLVWKNVSATPDSLMVPVWNADPLVLPDGKELTDPAVLEIKSLDPRANMDRPKDAHIAQVKLQIELFRILGISQPTGGVLLYVDASDYARRRWYWIDRDDTFLEKAMARAKRIQDAKEPMELLPEGIWDGGCQYCPFKKTCGEAVLRYVPLKEVELQEAARKSMRAKLNYRSKLTRMLELKAQDKIKAEEDIRGILREAGTNRATMNGTSISYLKQAGRRTLDADKLEEYFAETDHDLADFYKTSAPSARLTIKESG